MQIHNHTFLVTGGGSGLGAAAARMIVDQAGRVIIADIDAAAGKRAAEALGAAARFVKVNVTSEADAGAAVQAAMELSEGDGLRGVIHCAGIAPASRVVDREGQPHPLELFERVVAVNLIGTFNIARIAAAAMVNNEPVGQDGERGLMVQTASIAAFEGQMGQAAYAASKGGVVSMTLPIARELARHGIRVVTISPGVFQTPMMEQMPDKVRESLAASVPFPPRFGRPQEYAALVQQIIENPMLNGVTIRLDGGLRMAGK